MLVLGIAVVAVAGAVAPWPTGGTLPAVGSPSVPSAGPGSTAGTDPTRLFAGMLLVYSADGLTRAQLRGVGDAAGAAPVPVYVRELAIASGLQSFPDIPVLAMTVDPTSYARAVGRPELAAALRRGAVLAATEARLRHAGVGSRLRFSDGRRLTVSAIVDDHVLGGLELAVPGAFRAVPTAQADYALVADSGQPTATARLIRGALPAVPLRIKSFTANGYFSSADSVLTQLQVKARFGEFAIRRTGGAGLDQDQAWIDQHLVSVRVPQLGQVTCNRGVVVALRAAMAEVTDRGLGSTVHTADFQYQGGCWNPNVVPGTVGTISRHSWGLAVDINVDTNPFGERPHQDPRLVEIMRRHGFAWGGTWLRPDAMHFEYVGTPPLG
ncbi:MAG: family peptidase [Frankiales bacterium]|nr:family peptidase [Frankiales bacterium]